MSYCILSLQNQIDDREAGVNYFEHLLLINKLPATSGTYHFPQPSISKIMDFMGFFISEGIWGPPKKSKFQLHPRKKIVNEKLYFCI